MKLGELAILQDFPESNVALGKDQPEYQTLYADEAGDTFYTYKLTLRARAYVLLTGKMWLYQRTFNKPFQPIYPAILNPWKPKQDHRKAVVGAVALVLIPVLVAVLVTGRVLGW
jgi:hypothetical protein